MTMAKIQYDIKRYLSPNEARLLDSVLSPSTNWERNIIDAHAVCAAKDNENIVVTTYGQFLAKALATKNGRDPDTVISKVTGKKTWAFYQCISKPMNNLHVVVDRHALAIAICKATGDVERGLILSYQSSGSGPSTPSSA